MYTKAKLVYMVTVTHQVCALTIPMRGWESAESSQYTGPLLMRCRMPDVSSLSIPTPLMASDSSLQETCMQTCKYMYMYMYQQCVIIYTCTNNLKSTCFVLVSHLSITCMLLPYMYMCTQTQRSHAFTTERSCGFATSRSTLTNIAL